MSNPLIGGKYLVVNPEANTLHEEGLHAELACDYELAHQKLAAAHQVLDLSTGTMDRTVQAARIMRDDGFTFVREAIKDHNFRKLRYGREKLQEATALTAPIVSGTSFSWIDGPTPRHTVKKARAEVFAEHGATVSLLGRVATVGAVMHGIDTRSMDRAAAQIRKIDQQAYGLAHQLLRIGNNGYYRVSNAMVGARQERLNGRTPHMFVWLGRATMGLVWTALRDPSNLQSASRTIVGRLPHLRSYGAAKRSVEQKP